MHRVAGVSSQGKTKADWRFRMHFFPGACPRLRRTSGDVRVRTGCVGSCRLLCVNQSAENAQHAVQTYIREFCYPGTGLTGHTLLNQWKIEATAGFTLEGARGSAGWCIARQSSRCRGCCCQAPPSASQISSPVPYTGSITDASRHAREVWGGSVTGVCGVAFGVRLGIV